MEVPSESFHRCSWDSRTCYPRRAFNQRLTNESAIVLGSWSRFSGSNRVTPSIKESSSPWLKVVPLSSRPVDGVRKEKERLTAFH